MSNVFEQELNDRFDPGTLLHPLRENVHIFQEGRGATLYIPISLDDFVVVLDHHKYVPEAVLNGDINSWNMRGLVESKIKLLYNGDFWWSYKQDDWEIVK